MVHVDQVHHFSRWPHLHPPLVLSATELWPSASLRDSGPGGSIGIAGEGYSVAVLPQMRWWGYGVVLVCQAVGVRGVATRLTRRRWARHMARQQGDLTWLYLHLPGSSTRGVKVKLVDAIRHDDSAEVHGYVA